MDCSLHRRELVVADMRLSYVERDAEASTPNPAIVLLHGLIAEAEVFRKLIAELPTDRRIVALDLPGAGYSARPATADVSFQGISSIVREIITALDLQKPILLGHSHGGAIALQLAATHREAIGGLVLLCPAHPFSKHEDNLIRFWLGGIGRRVARVLPRLPRWLHLFAFRRMPGSRKSMGYTELAPYLHTLQVPGTVPHMLRLLESWREDMKRLGDSLQSRAIDTPVLLLWGDRDIVVPISTSTRLSQCLSQWEMFALPGVGHLPNEEAPEKCAGLVRTWLIRLETPPADSACSQDLLTAPVK